MAKKWLRLLPVFFLSAGVMMGCNNDEPAEDDNDTEQTPEDENMNGTGENNDVVPGDDNDDMDGDNDVIPDGENDIDGDNDIVPGDENDMDGDNDVVPGDGENNEDIIEDKKDMQDPDNKDE